jgi:hypothetical protein
MALSTYGELKTSVASWLARADLTTSIPDFVTLCHKQLMRDLRGHLRLQKRDTAFSVATEYVACPTDFLELVSMRCTSANPPFAVQFMDNDTGTNRYQAVAGVPAYVAVVGSTSNVENFKFSPPPSGTYTMTIEYYAMLTFFSSDAGVNWILTDHPDLYLYGSLLQATAFLSDDPRVPLWAQAYRTALESCKSAGKRARWGANGMTVRAA